MKPDKCNSCEMLSINGVACHEIGCPDVPHVCDCFQCGGEFESDSRHARVCPDCVAEAAWLANGPEFYEADEE